MIIVLAIVLLAIVLFLTEWLPIDVTGLLVALLLMLTGVLTPEEGFSGFSNVGTLSVLALLMLSIGLESTGTVNFLASRMEKLMTKSEFLNLLTISGISGIASAFLNNTAIVAILLPVVVRLSNISKTSSSKYLMPLSFAAMAGGCITIIGTSTNLIVSGIYEEKYGAPFGVFEFSLLGIAFFIIYLVYMLFLGRFLLPSRSKEGALTSVYKLDDYLTQVVVTKDSKLIGEEIREDFHPKYGIRVIEIIRDDGSVYVPEKAEKIQENDVLSIKCRIDTLTEMGRKWGLEIKKNVKLDDKDLTSEHALLFEGIISPNSSLIGQTVKNIDFRQLYSVIPLAIRRSGTSIPIKVAEAEIQFGDTFLMETRRTDLEAFRQSPDFIVLEKVKKPNYRYKRMALSALIVLGVILLASLNILPLPVAAFTGVLVMFITGCASPLFVYKRVEWRIILLLAGMIPLGIAVEKTGLSNMIVGQLLDVFQMVSPRVIISILFLVTVLLTSFMSNNATAILLAPIAISIAEQLGLEPKPFLLAVMMGASMSFLTPIGYQTNTLIYGPGKYKFVDYFKVGGLLTLLIWLAATYLIPLLYL